jgi:hypothetical protein
MQCCRSHITESTLESIPSNRSGPPEVLSNGMGCAKAHADGSRCTNDVRGNVPEQAERVLLIRPRHDDIPASTQRNVQATVFAGASIYATAIGDSATWIAVTQVLGPDDVAQVCTAVVWKNIIPRSDKREAAS